VAAFTGILTFLAIRQNRDSRIVQRAYLDVRPAGIKLWSTGDRLLAYLVIYNAGNLPASNNSAVPRRDHFTSRSHSRHTVD
jgi:hypothetical protein